MAQDIVERGWAKALKRLEDGEITHDALRLQLGISARQLKRRLTRARAVRLRDVPAEADPGRIELYQGPNQQGPSVTVETCEHTHRIQKGDSAECLDCGFQGLGHLQNFQPAPPLPEDPKPRGYDPDEPSGGTGPVIKEDPRWKVTLPDSTVHTVQARTKSDARAMAKKLIGIGSKGRLPIGTRITITTQKP